MPSISSNRLLVTTNRRNVIRIAKPLFIATLVLGSLSGCQTVSGLFGKVEDGSLDYKNESEKLAPLVLPADQQTAPFTPLYPLPDLGPNTLEVENEAGKRFQLPKPHHPANLGVERNAFSDQ